MAKEIGLKLKITSQGEEKVISNLNELEVELQKLQSTLKTLDFGSKAFKEATANIAKLRTKIDEIDKASEGIGAEKKFRAIGDAINILTGSFQVLSGALGLFITDEKSLEEVQKAEKAALDVLNIALGVNAINTALVESATLRKAAADKIATLATQGAALAQRALNAVMAANPIALVITAIAALTTAYVAFASETKKATKAVDENKIANEELNKLTEESAKLYTQEIDKIAPLIALSQSDKVSKQERLEVLKQIQKEYPDYLANQNLEKVGVEDIKKANDTLVKSIIEVAKAKAATNEIGKIYEERLQATLALEQAEVKFQQDRNAFLKLDPTPSQIEGKTKALRFYVDLLKKEIDKAEEERKVREKVALSFLEESKSVGKVIDAKKESAAVSKKETDAELENIQKRIFALDEVLKKLDEVRTKDLTYSSEILKKQEEIIGKQEQSLTNQTNTLTTAAKKLQQELYVLLRETIPSEDDAAKIKDGYIELFDTIGEFYEKGTIDLNKNLGFEDFIKLAETQIPGIGEKLKLVGEDGKQSFVEFFNDVGRRVKQIQELQKGLNINVLGDLETLNKLSDVEDKVYELRRDRVKLGLTENQISEKSLALINETFGFAEKQKQLEDKIQQQKEIVAKAGEKDKEKQANRLKGLEEELQKQKQISNTLLETINKSSDFYDIAIKINAEAEKNAQKIQDNLSKRRKELTRDELDGLKEYFAQNANQFQTLFTDIAVNIDDYIARVGVDGIKELIGSVEENFASIDGLSRSQLVKLQSYLMVVSNELSSSLGEDAEFFVKLLEKISKKIKELPTDSEKAFTETINSLKKVADQVLSAFNDISGKLSSIIQGQNSLLLEQLEYGKEQALAVIGEANTESDAENKKILAERAKVEKEYSQKKFEVEKNARITELQFGLANAIASGAQAIINAYATLPTPAAIPFSVILAGLTAAQVSLINDQINFVQGKTYIGRTGGLVEGSSHDTYGGGVPTMLEGGEFILNKEAVRAFGDQISSINTATGGKPMAIDDSRIVQAISKQNLSTKQPLKAYVLYNDIQNTTKLNNKIEQLARL